MMDTKQLLLERAFWLLVDLLLWVELTRFSLAHFQSSV